MYPSKGIVFGGIEMDRSQGHVTNVTLFLKATVSKYWRLEVTAMSNVNNYVDVDISNKEFLLNLISF